MDPAQQPYHGRTLKSEQVKRYTGMRQWRPKIKGLCFLKMTMQAH